MKRQRNVLLLRRSLDVGVQLDSSETTTLKGMYFQLVDNQVLSTQGQPDVFNLHCLTRRRARGGVGAPRRRRRRRARLCPRLLTSL